MCFVNQLLDRHEIVNMALIYKNKIMAFIIGLCCFTVDKRSSVVMTENHTHDHDSRRRMTVGLEKKAHSFIIIIDQLHPQTLSTGAFQLTHPLPVDFCLGARLVFQTISPAT